MPVCDLGDARLPVCAEIRAVLIAANIRIAGFVSNSSILKAVQSGWDPPTAVGTGTHAALRPGEAIEQVRLRQIYTKIWIVGLYLESAFDGRATAKGDAGSTVALIFYGRNEIFAGDVSQVIRCRSANSRQGFGSGI